MSVEDLDHPGEVRKRPRQPIDFIDDHDVDQSLFDVGQQLFERRTLHRRAGKAAVIICGLAQPPAFPLLTADVCLTGLALRVQRIELLLEALFGRLAGVDRAAPAHYAASLICSFRIADDASARRKAAPTLAKIHVSTGTVLVREWHAQSPA